MAAGAGGNVPDVDFPFDGMFGSYDQMQLQRGLQVYTEVCAACHGLEHVAIRTIGDEGGPGLPEDQVFAYAEFYEVFDPLLFDGEGDFRPATPADKFPGSSLSNAIAAAADLSRSAKASASSARRSRVSSRSICHDRSRPVPSAKAVAVTIDGATAGTPLADTPRTGAEAGPSPTAV